MAVEVAEVEAELVVMVRATEVCAQACYNACDRLYACMCVCMCTAYMCVCVCA